VGVGDGRGVGASGRGININHNELKLEFLHLIYVLSPIAYLRLIYGITHTSYRMNSCTGKEKNPYFVLATAAPHLTSPSDQREHANICYS
jgi:hypothetical protein